MQLGCLKQGGRAAEGVDLVNGELLETSSWPHAACLKVSCFGKHWPRVWKMCEEKVTARVELKGAGSLQVFQAMFSCFVF